MDKTVLLNLGKATCLLTFLLFILDSHEFQGDYLVAAMEFIVMSFILFLLFTIVYGVILGFRRLVKRTSKKYNQL